MKLSRHRFNRPHVLLVTVLAAAALTAVFAEEDKAPPKLISTASNEAFRIEYDRDLWITPLKGEAGRTRLPPPPGALPDESTWPRALISPDARWIYVDGYGASRGCLYHCPAAAGPGGDPLHFELVEGFPDAARKFFLTEAKSPKFRIEGTPSFVAWSADSARLLLGLSFYAQAPQGVSDENFPGKWLCYYNTSKPAFELTDRLRIANRRKLEMKLDLWNSRSQDPIISAESLGKEGPEIAAKERFAKADAQLNQAYARLLKRLAPDAQAQLREDERAWLNERAAAAWLHAGQSWNAFPEGSRLEGLVTATEMRVAEFQKRFGANGGVARVAEQPSGGVQYSGRYVPVKRNPAISFEFNTVQNSTGIAISFSVGQANGGGAAPEGEGQGQIDDAGALVFTFHDSFSNEGQGTLKAAKSAFVLQLDAKTVADARCLKYYGKIEVKKVK